MEESDTSSTFTTDSRKQSYHIHNLLWEDAEDFQVAKKHSKFSKRIKRKKHDKSHPQSFTFVLMNILAGNIANIWRFPAAAYYNGGGAFVIAYLITVIFITKPILHLEVALGQFTGKDAVDLWCVCPPLRGIAVGQYFAALATVSYYGVISAFALYYFVQSLNADILWVHCNPENKVSCFHSSLVTPDKTVVEAARSSSDIYFRHTTLKEIGDLEKGFGTPNVQLFFYLLIAWIFVGSLLYKGLKTTGIIAYVGAILPFIVLFVMAILTARLPGASAGLKYLFIPDLEKLDETEIWYEAAIQAFFSLNVSLGVASFLSSQRKFTHRLNRNICLITLMNTIMLILASSVVFATLGCLANVTKIRIPDKSLGGIELAIIIYTDAIAKVSNNPQGLAIAFFVMLIIAFVGSTATVMNSCMHVIWEKFPQTNAMIIALLFTVFGFISGAIYLTPNGLSILQLVDHYIVGGIMYHMALYEVAAIAYVYGLENFCKDITFMTKRKIHVYWRVCLGLVTPIFLVTNIYDYYTEGEYIIDYKGTKYPELVTMICLGLQQLGEIMIILWLLKELHVFSKKRRKELSTGTAFMPNSNYKPENSEDAADWKKFVESLKGCSFKEMTNINKYTYPIKVLLGTLNDDVFR